MPKYTLRFISRLMPTVVIDNTVSYETVSNMVDMFTDNSINPYQKEGYPDAIEVLCVDGPDSYITTYFYVDGEWLSTTTFTPGKGMILSNYKKGGKS